MNRFIIKYGIFKQDPKFYLGHIMKISKNRIMKHIIIDGCDIKYLDFLREKLIADKKINLYNKVITIKEPIKVIESNTYIADITNVQVSSYIAEVYYKQNIVGYSATKPLLNSLIEIKEGGTLFIYNTSIQIGDIINGINYSKEMYQNKFIGLKGKCSMCLNCLCNMNKKSGNIKGMVDENECINKRKIKELVPKEVIEVTQEQFTYIVEIMNEVINSADMITACTEILLKKGDK